ncbi:MAG: hypothetical protein JJ863_11380 [Deltaproteobacteria bacterium]|nr:hypothetical protein [Deltaproteobacteria bacterium]
MKPSEFDARLADLENEITKLRAIYEQWFQGIERVPPVRMRERLDRQVRRMRREAPNNTALRFKYQTIFQRWITFTQYWDRITRRIEEGTYARDIRRAKRRRAAAERQVEAVDEGPKSVEVDMDFDSMDMDAEINAALAALGSVGPSSKPPPSQPKALSLPNMDLDEHPAESKRPPPRPQPPARTMAKPPPPPGRPAPPRPPAPPGRPAPPPPPRPARSEGLRDDDVRRIFDRYVEARKSVGKRPDGVSYEKLASQIRKMEPKLQKKHAGKRIDFEVVVKDGKVGLKPVARRKSGDD